MLDVWRITHPQKKDFTFHSMVHDTYARLDYILVDHEILEHVVEATIGIISVSDHASVTVKIRFRDMDRRKGHWRLNEEVGRIKKMEIEQYFSINNTPEVSKATIWEAHKAYIRGKLISLGAGKKKKGK